MSALLAACTANPPTHCTVVPAASLPLQAASGHVYTDVMLNGQPVQMIVDTGANITVVSRAAADRLHLSAIPAGHAMGIGGSVQASLFLTDSFQIGRLRGKRFPLLVSDIAFPLGKQTADGLLGVDFLSSYDLDFNLPARRLDLFSVSGQCGAEVPFLDGPISHAPLLPSGHRLDFRPRVAVTMNGRRMIAMIDTGAPHTVMFRDAAELAGLSMDMAGAQHVAAARGIGRHSVEAVLVTAPLVGLGALTIRNMPVEIIDQYAGADDADMIIGMDFVARIHVWFSFTTHDLVMQAPSR